MPTALGDANPVDCAKGEMTVCCFISIKRPTHLPITLEQWTAFAGYEWIGQ